MTAPELLPQTAALQRAATIYRMTKTAAEQLVGDRAESPVDDRRATMTRVREFWVSNHHGLSRSDVAAAYLAAAETARDEARAAEHRVDRATISELATASYIEATNTAHVDAWQSELASAGIDPELVRHLAFAEVPVTVAGGKALAEVSALDTLDEIRARPYPDPAISELLSASQSVGTKRRNSASGNELSPLHRPGFEAQRDNGIDASW
ncbi:hypothetical protein GCM10007304_14170 [Rhodococcoides trifolii]|uniref:Uncharacterized protein n=1 Tax=Rhodococcoides trifolii TaxID=908250 RepID=A0A917CX24_9NOCA|nr:hypothetical protein [Rhodococcus trifolii]GGG01348.1 hypothetical protein GCM10007304_14170 [Rhodococcus trifolii]